MFIIWIIIINVFNQVLSKKVALLYKLCKEELSNPLKYTFDLRSIKIAIKFARKLLINQQELEEDTIIMKILRLV